MSPGSATPEHSLSYVIFPWVPSTLVFSADLIPWAGRFLFGLWGAGVICMSRTIFMALALFALSVLSGVKPNIARTRALSRLSFARRSNAGYAGMGSGAGFERISYRGCFAKYCKVMIDRTSPKKILEPTRRCLLSGCPPSVSIYTANQQQCRDLEMQAHVTSGIIPQWRTTANRGRVFDPSGCMMALRLLLAVVAARLSCLWMDGWIPSSPP